MAPRKKKDEETEVKTKTSYSHYIPAAPVLENFEEVYKLKYHLIKSYDELMNFYKNEFKHNSFFAWDTETSSLNPEQGEKTGDAVEGKIVGYSFTQNGTDGYYVPLCHPDYALGYKALKVLYAMLCKSKLHLLYNARFDMRFLEHMTPEKYGYTPEPDEKIYSFDLSKTKYFDVQCSVWLSDSNVPMPSLKKSEKHFLGWNPPTFDETTGGEANFGYLPAEQGYRYACIEENTLIKTINGNKKIKDITVSDIVYSSSGLNKVLAIYNNGIKHTIKCTYKNDYTLVCTPDHKIAVNTVLGPRLVQAKDLDSYTTLYTGGINFNDLNNLNQDYSTLSFNVSALQNIDFMYWLLGFTMTDGNLVNNRLAYRVQKRDEHILYGIKNYVKSQSKIFETLSKSPNDNSIHTATNLYICNKVCCDFMREHGMTENKSTRKSYSVSDDVFPSFLRGIYDGDGSSNGNNICFIGYPEFIEKLQSDIYRLYGLTSSLHKNKPDDKVIVMTFTKYASLQLMNIMYGGATIFIKRKMEKALRKHRLFYVSKYNNYKKRANYTEIAREPVGVEEFQKLDHICKSFNINSSALSRVISGKWKQYKGLTVTTNIGKLYKIAPNSMIIEDIGDRQVFDLQIENDPSFITSNGFIVHNCIDALGTYHLFLKTERFYAEAGAAGKLDNEVLYPIMKLENTPIYVDNNYLASMRGDILKHLEELKQYLYTEAGTEYNISSGRELAKIFQQMGIDTGERTATGQMKTDIKTINNYQTTHGNNTYLKKLVEYKQLLKFDNSYLETLLKISTPEEVKKHPIRFNYFTCRVPCLTENNRVLIKDRGLISIKDCKAGDYIWTQYGYKKVLWNNSHFANDIYKVTFKNGYTIEGTGHHPVLVNKTGRSKYLDYEWAGLADLKHGEHIVLNHKPCENYNADIEYDFARLIGFIDGDGSIATQDRVKLCYWVDESNELKEYYGNLLSKYSNSELHYDLSQKESHHAIVQAVYNTKFNAYLHSLGVRGDGVPKCILNSSPKIWLAYLQGIWDSDGNISLHNDNRKYPQVGIKLIKKQTVHDIGLMLLMLGIPNSLLNINYYKGKQNCREQLRCRVRDHIGYVLFKNLISDYMKSNKKLKFESLNIDNNYIEYAQTTVKSVEKIENTIVYDIEVEDVHEYIANGIVTHNTGRLACGTDGKNTFFSHVNFQSLPKPHSHNYHCHKATDEQIAKGEDLCGWIFDDNPEGSLGLAEGQDPHLNVRKAFVPKDKDSVIVSVDMCLEGGSPVQTKRGYIGISDLKVDDEIYTQNGYVKVTRVKNTGLKKLFKIKTSGQSIYCSEDHPFIINGKQVQANHVKETLIQEDIPTYIEYNIKKELISNKFIDLENIDSVVEKANYIKNNNLINDFIEAYNNYTASDVAKMCFIKNSSFRHIINYLNLNKKCHKEFCRLSKQHVFNPFKSSNPTSVYLLGYILGDGNISVRRNNYYTLNITSKDYEHINQIKNIFDNNIQLAEHNKNGHKAWSLTITDQDVCNDLIKLGIIPRKSYCNSDINFNWIDNNLSHFIRGLIDSDGCIRTYNKNNNSIEISISGNASYLNALNIISEYNWSIRDIKNSKCSILRLLGNSNSSLDFYKYIYKNATIWLQRKRDIYDNWIISKYGELPEFEMYDITIDSEDHIYFCNGVLTHNCAEELRLAANVFNEPTWINAFNTGQDVHKACYSDDTEFLTKDGWKTYDKIAEDTLIAQYDNGNISYVPAGPVYYGNTGELYRFKTKYNDLLVTSNHRMLYRTSYKNKEKIKSAEDLNYGQFRNAAVYDCDDLTEDFIFEDCYGDGFNINKKYADGFSLKPDTLIKFLGFYFGDGHAGVHNNRYRINLIQSCCDAKKETLQWIRDLNKEMGDFFKEYFHSASVPSVNSIIKNTGSSYYTFEQNHKTFCKWIIDNCIKDGIKRIPEFIFNLSLRQRKLFIDAFFKADGTHDKRKGRKGFTLYIYHKELLDDFQRLCIMSNYSTYIDYKHKQISGIYRMSVHPNVWHNFNKINITKEFYNGKTVCYSVPSGVLIVRRNDKVSICGNTAIKIFGEEKYCKEARKRAKTANFGILYGSSAYGFHNQFPDMSLEECEDFIEKFKAALPSIEAGQLAAVRYGKKNGYVKTYFGRPRRVKYYFNSPDRSMQGFGKRTCMNTIIQGAAGDLIKLMLIRLWNDLFVPYKDKGVSWVGSIHDEVNYVVPKSLLKEVVPIIMRCQTVILPDWKVPMLPDLSIGFSFGSLIPFDIVYNEDGTVKEFVPQMEPLKTDEVVEEPVEDNYIPEIGDDDYDYLQ